MTTKNVKTILFASLFVVAISSFGILSVNAVGSVNENTSINVKDKTTERLLDKEAREENLQKLKTLANEEMSLLNNLDELKNQPMSEENYDAKKIIEKRLAEIRDEMRQMQVEANKNDIPQEQLGELMKYQDIFETRLLDSDVRKYVTSVGINLASKEIQIGLNENLVSSENIDSIVDQITEIMPDNAEWHVVYSDVATFLSCTQKECDPIIGGNFISVTNGLDCSYGFQATKGTDDGFVTAGHCADGLVGNSVKDYSGNVIGTVDEEEFSWGTSCDCAWITADDADIGNYVFYVPSTQYQITDTTQASEQQNDYIMKSGQDGDVDFGQVSDTNVTVFTSEYYVKNLVRSNAVMNHGDSGGTIVENGDRSDLYGIVAVHDVWGYYHTPIDQITAHLGVSPVLG